MLSHCAWVKNDFHARLETFLKPGYEDKQIFTASFDYTRILRECQLDRAGHRPAKSLQHYEPSPVDCAIRSYALVVPEVL